HSWEPPWAQAWARPWRLPWTVWLAAPCHVRWPARLWSCVGATPVLRQIGWCRPGMAQGTELAAGARTDQPTEGAAEAMRAAEGSQCPSGSRGEPPSARVGERPESSAWGWTEPAAA